MADPDAAQPAHPEETLAWEAANRGKAAVSAWCAAALTITGAVLTGVAFNNLPEYTDRVVTVPDALADLAAGEPIPAGRAVSQLRYIGDHPLPFVAGPLLSASAALFAYLVLAYLFRATRARAPQTHQGALVAAAVGAVAYAVGTAVVGIARVLEGRGLADDATNSAALDAIGSGPIVAGTIIQLVGAFALGLAFVLISLNAMRAGLLTRFMGFLGIIVGATFVLPLDQQGIIRSFWLLALGFLLARRWPSGVPPAWDSGRAEPWPSAAEAREQRMRDAGTAPAPEPAAPAPPAPDDGPTQGQRRKKRKRK